MGVERTRPSFACVAVSGGGGVRRLADCWRGGEWSELASCCPLTSPPAPQIQRPLHSACEEEERGCVRGPAAGLARGPAPERVRLPVSSIAGARAPVRDPTRRTSTTRARIPHHRFCFRTDDAPTAFCHHTRAFRITALCTNRRANRASVTTPHRRSCARPAAPCITEPHARCGGTSCIQIMYRTNPHSPPLTKGRRPWVAPDSCYFVQFKVVLVSPLLLLATTSTHASLMHTSSDSVILIDMAVTLW